MTQSHTEWWTEIASAIELPAPNLYNDGSRQPIYSGCCSVGPLFRVRRGPRFPDTFLGHHARRTTIKCTHVSWELCSPISTHVSTGCMVRRIYILYPLRIWVEDINSKSKIDTAQDNHFSDTSADRSSPTHQLTSADRSAAKKKTLQSDIRNHCRLKVAGHLSSLSVSAKGESWRTGTSEQPKRQSVFHLECGKLSSYHIIYDRV